PRPSPSGCRSARSSRGCHGRGRSCGWRSRPIPGRLRETRSRGGSMPDELTLPPYRVMDPDNRVRQAHALAALVHDVPDRRRRRRFSFALGTVALAVATTGAGAAYVAFAPVTEHTTVSCYTAPILSARDLGTQTNYRPDD